jgi:hypothetical protein
MEKDYIIIQSDGTPTQFIDEEIIIYGDYEEAKSDNYPDDMGICEIDYRVENGTQIAYVSKPNSDVLLGSFDYDDKIDNFQVRLKEFLNEHPFVNTNNSQF